MERQLRGLMVRHMNFSVRKALANKLDPDTTVEGNDWRMLADKLKYNYEEILSLNARQVQHGSNTMKLLEDYGLKMGSTLQNLWTQLEAIDRPDAVEVIEKALHEIRKAQLEEEKPQLWDQNTDSNASVCSHGGSHMLLYQRHHPSEPCCNHSYRGGHAEGCQHSALE